MRPQTGDVRGVPDRGLAEAEVEALSYDGWARLFTRARPGPGSVTRGATERLPRHTHATAMGEGGNAGGDDLQERRGWQSLPESTRIYTRVSRPGWRLQPALGGQGQPDG